MGRGEADALYAAIQSTRIPPPSTDCVVPIGEQRLLAGLHQVVPGEFFTAATRPPGVYRGNPFVIEAALAYGGAAAARKVSLEALTELAAESDARSLRQFLATTFGGVGTEAADKILTEATLTPRHSPSKLKKASLRDLHEAMKHVNLDEGQSMNVLPLPIVSHFNSNTQPVQLHKLFFQQTGGRTGSHGLVEVFLVLQLLSWSTWQVCGAFTSESKEALLLT